MDFLVKRPVAVIMAFLAFVVIGLVIYRTLPVSLLPDIAIPQITIQATDADKSARELENTVIANIRQQLLQLNGLEELRSNVRDGIGVIDLRFKFGINTDYSYIEVNEKIDAAMNYLPSGTQRPKAIKASATDIPVFYLNIALKDRNADNAKFLEMCTAVDNVIRRRIEQLPEVAMADATGMPRQCVKIYPDYQKMSFLDLTISDISNALTSNNIEAGSMRVKDGVFEYTIKVSTLLNDIADIENIYLSLPNRHIQLRDICRISLEIQQEQGLSLANNRRVVTLAVIKQADEGMDIMKQRIQELLSQFGKQFPEFDFEICRNQTELLDYTISNLKQNLIIGFVFILIVAMLFMGGVRPSIVIGISMLVAIVITFVPFYMAGRSLNIVSLSGLILVVGMMIDNFLIVSENIGQWQQRGIDLHQACVGATSEMITPLLSSSLTTVAVFIPLVFVSGMAGSLFSDQAFAITAGLGVSYIVGIVLLPVLYKILMPKIETKKSSKRMNLISQGYDKVFDFVVAHRTVFLIIALATLPLCWLGFNIVDKSKMPTIHYNETVVHIDWDEEISLIENRIRTDSVLKAVAPLAQYSTAYVGVQDYIVERGGDMSITESELYWKASSPDTVALIKDKVTNFMAENFPKATFSFAPPTTIFERLFETSQADIEARLSYSGAEVSANEIMDVVKEVRGVDTSVLSTMPAFKTVRLLNINREALQLYNVDLNSLKTHISNMIAGSRITELHSYNSYLPVFLAEIDDVVEDFINKGNIRIVDKETKQPVFVPVRHLVKISSQQELKNIVAGKAGEYIPICFYGINDGDDFNHHIFQAVRSHSGWDVDFGGAFFASQELLRQLVVILLISLMLMYFILCAQFESLRQPIVVLLEIPIDTAFALLVIWASGHTLNLMSGIGIIVSCGIIVNDTILKIDTINELRRNGMPLLEAVHTAGRRRLRAIVMTSLTTIGATLPILFTSDMGSELQQPLAVAMIATMVVGTLVSLYIVPLIYTLLENKRL